MASVPLTEDQAAEDWVVLNLEKVGFSDEQFVELCSDNRDFHLELTARKELVIMTPPGGKTGLRNDALCRLLSNWAKQKGKGITFSPGTWLHVPDGAKRALDASWL